MQGIAARRFSTAVRGRKKTFQSGEAVDLPDNQFADFLAVGLVVPKSKTVKRAQSPETELPNPGNETSNNGAEE